MNLERWRLFARQVIRQRVTEMAASAELARGGASAEQAMRRWIDQDGRFELLYLVGADGVQVSENILSADLQDGSRSSARGKNWSNRPPKLSAMLFDSQINPINRIEIRIVILFYSHFRSRIDRSHVPIRP